MLFCTCCVFVAFFFLFPFFSFFFFLRLLDLLEEDGRICQRYFSLFFFFFFFFKSLLFPHKRKRAAHYYPKKSFEANGARGRLDEEGSLNDTAGGLSRLLRRRRLLFFPRRCFEGFLEGLPRVVHTIFGRSRSNFWREVIV